MGGGYSFPSPLPFCSQTECPKEVRARLGERGRGCCCCPPSGGWGPSRSPGCALSVPGQHIPGQPIPTCSGAQLHGLLLQAWSCKQGSTLSSQMTQRGFVNWDKLRAEQGSLWPSAQPLTRGPPMLPPVLFGIQGPPAPSTHHAWHWACLLDPCGLCPFWTSLATSHMCTHQCLKGLSQAVWGPRLLFLLPRLPHSTLSGCGAPCPNPTILVTICLPANRILSFYQLVIRAQGKDTNLTNTEETRAQEPTMV